MKKIFWFRLVPLLIIVAIFYGLYKLSWQGNDLSILMMNQEKVEIIDVSPERGMINIYDVTNKELWIPNGMGWYPALRLSLIVKNDENLARRVAFFNFGFWPKYVMANSSWNSDKTLWKLLGPFGWIRYKMSADDWLWRDESINNQDLSEIMPRDMADNEIISQDIKINIINSSSKNGLGNMVADRLEWWGVMVTSVQTGEERKKCQLSFPYQERSKKFMDILATIFNCDKVDGQKGYELILGTETEEMLKYSQTYVRSL